MVTSGPTWEAIDPVRVIANRSSGRQGHAIAAALAAAGAQVVLVTGPVGVADPPGARVERVESAAQMLAAVEGALPADIFVGAAAVADWAPRAAGAKLKKADRPPALDFTRTPDIVAAVAAARPRPALVVAFAAETDDVVAQAQGKRAAKAVDWVVANPVGGGRGFGDVPACATLVTADGAQDWGTLSKEAVAARLVDRAAAFLGGLGA